MSHFDYQDMNYKTDIADPERNHRSSKFEIGQLRMGSETALLKAMDLESSTLRQCVIK